MERRNTKMKAITLNNHKKRKQQLAWENAWGQVTIGFASHWSRKWREFFFFFNQSSSVVKQNQSKPELLSTLNAKTRTKRVFLFEMTVTIWKAYIWASD